MCLDRRSYSVYVIYLRSEIAITLHPLSFNNKARKEFENNLSLSEIINTTNINQDILLMPPVSSGIISSAYDPNKGHFGVDFVCKEEEPIKSTLDGTVLFSSWTKAVSYTHLTLPTKRIV